MAFSDDEITVDLTAEGSDGSDTLSVASYRTNATSVDNFHDCDVDYRTVTLEKMSELSLHKELAEDLRVITIIIKDAHDVEGSGMTFWLSSNNTFKHVFDAFKTASCKNCRSVEDIRFKIGAKKLKSEDSPKVVSCDNRAAFLSTLTRTKFRAKHGETISITAFSNTEGRRCDACKKVGYPSSSVERLDGNRPIIAMAARDQPMRLFFLDANGKMISLSTRGGTQMRDVLSKYAKRSECTLRSLFFFFDGEAIASDDTPDQVGREIAVFLGTYMADTPTDGHEE